LIASTGTAMAALKSDGTVIAWGDSSKGGNTALVSAQLIGVTAIYSCARAFRLWLFGASLMIFLGLRMSHRFNSLRFLAASMLRWASLQIISSIVGEPVHMVELEVV
jgi:hypothetical protein